MPHQIAMEETSKQSATACPHCDSTVQEADAVFCQTCGWKLDTALLRPTRPPNPSEPGRVIVGRFVVGSLLWTAPTYNAYEATAQDAPATRYLMIEKRQSFESGGSSDGPTQNSSSNSLEEAASAFERFGLLRPVEQIVEDDSGYMVLEHVRGQPLAYFDQADEK